MLDPGCLPRLLQIAAERTAQAEPAHDFLHVLRVTANARRIGEAEGAAPDILLPAAVLHELFNHPKGHPERHLSGEVCAERARPVLLDEGFTVTAADAVCACIRLHPWSLGVVPASLEARVLQDADRLDALGALGVARCFATCAVMGRPFYHPADPFCRTRPPDDARWGLDHFYRKLLRIPEGLHTATGRALAADRVRFLQAFLSQVERELELR
jgi:uncharacterized protein